MPEIISNGHNPKRQSKVQELVKEPSIHSPDFKSALVDASKERIDSLVQYSTGSKQTVVYFRQRLGRDDSVTHFSLATSATNQQYERIDGMEILVQTPYNFTVQQDNRNVEITGEAHILQPVIPNVGDVMLMDIGRGAYGIFSINNVRRLSHRRNTLHEVTYQLLKEVKDQKTDEWMINLNQKTIEVFKWSNDFLKHGQNPLISPENADLFDRLAIEYKRLLKLYFRTFFVRYHETCLIPNQSLYTYDHFLAKYISRTFTSRDTPDMVNYRVYSTDEMPVFDTVSFWDALSERDPHLLKESFKQAATMVLSSFTPIPIFAQIRFSGLHGIVVPSTVSYNNEIYSLQNDNIGILGKRLIIQPTVSKTPYKSINGKPLINQVFPDKGYVFSPDFWHDNPDGMSHLEVQTMNYFQDEQLQGDILLELIEDVSNWGELEKYYYVPVLMCLINYHVRKM